MLGQKGCNLNKITLGLEYDGQVEKALSALLEFRANSFRLDMNVLLRLYPILPRHSAKAISTGRGLLIVFATLTSSVTHRRLT
jgi:hypothetical protein